MQVLVPVEGIMDRLEASVAKQKDKMEKTAANMVKQSVKKKDREAKAAAKKGRGKPVTAQGNCAMEAMEVDFGDVDACRKQKENLERMIQDEQAKDANQKRQSTTRLRKPWKHARCLHGCP